MRREGKKADTLCKAKSGIRLTQNPVVIDTQHASSGQFKLYLLTNHPHAHAAAPVIEF